MTISNPTTVAIRDRRSVRAYSSREIPEELLIELLDLANRAPSGFNLQPWHFIVVRNPELKQVLCPIALDQVQILSAAAIIIFVADPHSWKTFYPDILRAGLQNRSLTPERAEKYGKRIKQWFDNGPLGILGLGKRIAVPLMRVRRPLPHPVSSAAEAKEYVRRHTMLAASTFMIAAKSVGVVTCPMEGFDEHRLMQLLEIPAYMTVPIIITAGYPLDFEQTPRTARVPIDLKLSFDLFPNKLRR